MPTPQGIGQKSEFAYNLRKIILISNLSTLMHSRLKQRWHLQRLKGERLDLGIRIKSYSFKKGNGK